MFLHDVLARFQPSEWDAMQVNFLPRLEHTLTYFPSRSMDPIPREKFLELLFSVSFDPDAFYGKTPLQRDEYIAQVCLCLFPYTRKSPPTCPAADAAALSFGHKSIIKRCLQALVSSRLASGARLTFHSPLTLISVIYRAPSLHAPFYNRGVHTLVVQHYWDQLKLGLDWEATAWSAGSLLTYILG